MIYKLKYILPGVIYIFLYNNLDVQIRTPLEIRNIIYYFKYCFSKCHKLKKNHPSGKIYLILYYCFKRYNIYDYIYITYIIQLSIYLYRHPVF